MIDAVIFDLFGTLIHLPRDTRPYLQLCRELGGANRLRESLVVEAPTLAAFCDFLGMAYPNNLADIQRDLEADIAHAALFEDALPTLRALRQHGLPTGLISNVASPYKRAYFDLGLNELIDVAVFSCDIGHAKPAREIYEVALKRLGTSPQTTLMIGDSPRCDVAGPHACSIRAVLLDRHATTPSVSSFRSLSEILSLLDA